MSKVNTTKVHTKFFEQEGKLYPLITMPKEELLPQPDTCQTLIIPKEIENYNAQVNLVRKLKIELENAIIQRDHLRKILEKHFQIQEL